MEDKGYYKRLPSYRHMLIWFNQLRLVQRDWLISALWESCFDYRGHHKRRGKMRLKERFPARMPHKFREFKVQVEGCEIMRLIGDCDYELGSTTLLIFDQAVMEYRSMKAIASKVQELESKILALENKSARSYETLDTRLSEFKDYVEARFRILSGDSLEVIKDD